MRKRVGNRRDKKNLSLKKQTLRWLLDGNQLENVVGASGQHCQGNALSQNCTYSGC